MSGKYKLTISVKGPALEDNSIDVRQLAPAMLSLGRLFENTNAVLNEDKAIARLRAVATNAGSFEISFVLDQTFLQAARDFFHNHLYDADMIAAFLFFDVNVGISLSSLLKFLRGNKPDKVTDKGDIVEIRLGNNSVVINKPVYNIYLNGGVRKEMENFIEPLSDEGVESIEISDQDHKKQVINKQEKEYFIAESPDEEILTSNEVELVLAIAQIGKPTDYKWRLNDGDRTQFYLIKDKNFADSIVRGRKFTLNDKFKCKVRIVQKRNKLTNKIVVEREILEVLKHIEFTEEQRELF